MSFYVPLDYLLHTECCMFGKARFGIRSLGRDTLPLVMPVMFR